MEKTTWDYALFMMKKSPSFSVTPDKQLAYCFGCHKGGSPITFLSQIKNISAYDAAVIRKKIGITFSNEKNQKRSIRKFI